jgi:hypothetical protein
MSNEQAPSLPPNGGAGAPAHCSCVVRHGQLHLGLHLLDIFGSVRGRQLAQGVVGSRLSGLGTFGGVGSSGQGRQRRGSHIIVTVVGRGAASGQSQQQNRRSEQRGQETFRHHEKSRN